MHRPYMEDKPVSVHDTRLGIDLQMRIDLEKDYLPNSYDKKTGAFCPLLEDRETHAGVAWSAEPEALHYIHQETIILTGHVPRFYN